MLADLLAALERNTEATRLKGDWFRAGFVATMTGVAAGLLLILLR
jgi:hypothetical protein